MRSRVMPAVIALAAALVCADRRRARHAATAGVGGGRLARFVVRVPTERDNAATTKVTVRFPEQVLEARFQPIDGWDREVKMAKLDRVVRRHRPCVDRRGDVIA